MPSAHKTSFAIPPEVERLMKRLGERLGLTRSEVLRLAIQTLAKQVHVR